MSVLADLIIKHDGDRVGAGAEMIQLLMADGPNFKLGYTAGNAWQATLDAFDREGLDAPLPILLIDKAFPKPEKAQVYVSVSGGIAEVAQTRPSYSVDQGTTVDIVVIDWDNWDSDYPEPDWLEALVDRALRLWGGDNSAAEQMAEVIRDSLDHYEGDVHDEGSDRNQVQFQLDRLDAVLNKERANA